MHQVSHFLLTVAVLLSLGAVAGAWRLSRGPVDVGFLRGRIEQAINKTIAPARVTIGGASIAWGGFSRGLDQPLVLRATDVSIDNSTATGDKTAGIAIPVADAALSARWMLIGRILPRSITLRGAHLMLVRGTDRSRSFNIGAANDAAEPSSLTGLLAVLGTPRQTDLQTGGGRLSQLSEISIHGATLRVDDRLSARTLSADRADIDLFRHRGGGLDGKATVALALGGQKATLTGTFDLAPEARSAHVAASLSRITPKALADYAPVLAPLAALDAPLTMEAEADFGPDLIATHIRATARVGAGKFVTGDGSIPVRRAELTVAGTPEQAAVEAAVVELQPASGAPVSTIAASGQLTHQAGRLGATLHVTLDHADFADLPALWPPDIARHARAWITRNIQAGVAHDGKADLVLDTPDTTADVSLTKATAVLEGDRVAVTWLPALPRIEQAKAHLVLTEPDKIEIDVRSARQLVNGADSIAIPYGHVTITDLTRKDQVATIQCDANGSIPSMIALLKEPRLRILDRHPMDLREPSGDARISIHAVVPLFENLQIDDVSMHGTGTLSKVHLTGILAGRDLDDGAVLLDADTSHLSIKGTARLAGIQSDLDGTMDFRAGPPTQVVQRYQVTGQATAEALSAAGLDTEGALAGKVGLSLTLSEHRSGDGELTADADLSQAELTIAPLAWRKPAGSAATASARAILWKDKLTGVDRLTVSGAGIEVRGGISVVGGRLDSVTLDRAVLGRTDVRGSIRLPRSGVPSGLAGAGDTPVSVDLTGPTLDVAAKLLEKSPRREPATAERPGPPWSMRGRFDRVFLAHGQTVSQLAATGDSDGRVIRDLSITGRTAAGKPFSMRIASTSAAATAGPGPNLRPARRLAINMEDAGSVLAGADVTQEIQGGVLTVDGAFDDTNWRHTLSGTLVLNDFRVIHAPALGKLLQAVTLYGLVDALGGPGLNFSRLTAPFQIDNDTLTLRDARAFSPSLGVTVRGQIDRAADRLDLRGTLVPAYVFNSILGRLPLIGGLFSAEKGGGLFAMDYSLRGPMNDPTVAANPLSALTPGILRGMFGLFDPPPGQPPPLDHSGLGDNARPP